jgi:glutaredoxin 3
MNGAPDGSSILVYTTGWCPFCVRAKALLERKSLPYREINVEDDPALRAEMTQRTGRRTVPQIFIGDTHVGGFEELSALDRAGGLTTIS